MRLNDRGISLITPPRTDTVLQKSRKRKPAMVGRDNAIDCKRKNVPATLERSRSGNGGHIWIFFSEPVAASEARKLGAALLTESMENCPKIGLESYDRFFPNQDSMTSRYNLI